MEPGATVEPTSVNPHQAFAKYFRYDAASRLVEVDQGDSVVVRLYRDGAGRIIARSTPSAGSNTYASFYHGRDILQRNALGQLLYAANFYGADGAAGVYHQESFVPDALGRLKRESHKFLYGNNWVDIESAFDVGDWFRTGVVYDNNLTGDTDDLWIDQAQDAIGRLQQLQWRTTAAGAPAVLANYAHDGNGIRRRTTHWGTGPTHNFNTTYRYDVYGRMDRIEQSFSAMATVDFHYDLASNLLKEVYQKQGGASQKGDRFAYDEHHRLAKAWFGSDQAHLDATDPNGTVGTFVSRLTYGLDAANNRTSLETKAGQSGATTTISYSTFDDPPTQSNRYDQVGDETPAYDQRGNTIVIGNLFCVYDDQNRLTELYLLSSDSSSASASSQSAALSGSSMSSLVARREHEEALGAFIVADVGELRRARSRILERIPGGAPELLRRHREAGLAESLAEPLAVSAVYRNTPSSSPSLLSGSAANSTEAAEMTPLAVYLYDYGNRRVARLVLIAQQSWFYAWDGWREAQELILGVDASTVVLKPERQFVWGGELDELVAYRYRQPGQTFASFFVAESGAHCPTRVLSASGMVVEVQEYDAYGRASVYDGSGTYIGGGTQSAVGNWSQWKGQRLDPETGFVYARNRFYSAVWGRFLTQDPLGVWTDTASLGNDYAYGACNPLTNSDPLGLQINLTLNQLGQDLGMMPGDTIDFAQPAESPSGKSFSGLRMDDEGNVHATNSNGAYVFFPTDDYLESPNWYQFQKKLFHLLDGASFGLSHLAGRIPCPESPADKAAELGGGLVPIGAIANAARNMWKAVQAARTAKAAAAAKGARTAATSATSVSEGRTVLGHYPGYIEQASELGARRFNLPGHIWDKMTDAERWAANQKFLDRLIKRGDEVILSTPADQARAGSFFARELEYLQGQGYRLVDGGTRLVPRQ
jgi:RHS repeat-associated protein